MVFKHSSPYFHHEDSFQFAFPHIRQLDCGSRASSGHRHIPEKQHFADGGSLGGNLGFHDLNGVSPNDDSGCALDNPSNLSMIVNSNGESIKLENGKRPSASDEDVQLVAKRTKQIDVSFPLVESTSSDDEFKSRKHPAVLESANDFRGGSFCVPWFSCVKNNQDNQVEPIARLSSFPGYYDDLHLPVGFNQTEESELFVFNCLPRKPVAVGPDHQADIPVWSAKSYQGCHPAGEVDASTSKYTLAHADSSENWIRHCVIPMPDSDSPHLEVPHGGCKTDCGCLDEGSVQCVRQHVMESRIELRSTLGHEKFVELGFCDMGEDVALRWTKEEERLFHVIVESNPASLYKNFWDVLPQAFPSKSRKELVSYYFNVFMLRKRADQNRYDPSNVDSDDDEWHGDDDVEDEDDSGVESPAGAAADGNNRTFEHEVHVHDEDRGDESDDDGYGLSVACPRDGKIPFCPSVQTIGEDQDLHDLHDDSCTSYEEHNSGANESGGADVLVEECRDSVGKEVENTMSCMGGQVFITGPSDPKSWDDIGYMPGLDKDLEFLPTCNVIEEVLRSEPWETSNGIS